MDKYGHELVVDLHCCNPERFTREDVGRFMRELCVLIDMKPKDLYFWDIDDPTELATVPDHLPGLTAVQFILTSSITLHTSNKLGAVYLNIFSCKDFGHGGEGDIKVVEFAKAFFSARDFTYTALDRGSGVFASAGLGEPQ